MEIHWTAVNAPRDLATAKNEMLGPVAADYNQGIITAKFKGFFKNILPRNSLLTVKGNLNLFLLIRIPIFIKEAF